MLKKIVQFLSENKSTNFSGLRCTNCLRGYLSYQSFINNANQELGFYLTTKDTQSTTLRNHKEKKASMNLEKFLNTVLSDTHGGENHLFKAISL